MPNFLLNLWGCNQWERETDREAAVASQQCSEDWGRTADEIIDEIESGMDGGGETTAGAGSPLTVDQWYADLTADWPDVAPVIAGDKFISSSSQEAKDHWKEHWWKGTPEDTMQCFDYAAYQLVVADFFTTDWLPDTTTYQVYRDGSGVDVNEVVEGVRYLKQALADGTPVLVGIQITDWDERPNRDKTTNHYVVIVGMGTSAVDGSRHFLYYDYLFSTGAREMALKPDLKIEGRSDKYLLAQIRQSVAL